MGDIKAASDALAAHGAVVTVRLNPQAVRLVDVAQKPFALRQKLRSLKKTNQTGCWPVALTGAAGQTPVVGRLCVLRKSQAAIAKAFCTSKSRETVSWARELLGGNGIVIDYNVARFFADAGAI